jgi:ATP-dependent Clp protease ATP-binding subunit ClpC
MFERFSEEARRSLFFALYKTTERNGDLITDDDLLSGICLGGPAAIELLGRMAADSLRSEESGEQVLVRMERNQVPGTTPGRFSASASSALQFATAEADSLLHDDIGPEHLLLGLLRDETTVAWCRLNDAGVRLSDFRLRVKALHEGGPAA